MAFPTKDGQRKFGSAFRAKKYDEFHAPSAEHEKKESPVFEEAEKEGQKEMGNEDAHSVVAEHGPAVHVHTHHDHKNGKHKVVSHHEDGHMHSSEHATAAEAHEEGGKLAGVDAKDENPDEAQQGADSEQEGYEQPDLA